MRDPQEIFPSGIKIIVFFSHVWLDEWFLMAASVAQFQQLNNMALEFFATSRPVIRHTTIGLVAQRFPNSRL